MVTGGFLEREMLVAVEQWLKDGCSRNGSARRRRCREGEAAERCSLVHNQVTSGIAKAEFNLMTQSLSDAMEFVGKWGGV